MTFLKCKSKNNKKKKKKIKVRIVRHGLKSHKERGFTKFRKTPSRVGEFPFKRWILLNQPFRYGVLCSVFHRLTSDLACLQSPGRRNFAYFGIIMDIQFYTLQLVKVSTVFVFLGGGLLERDSESQEDHYLFEICQVEHSAQICHKIASSCVSSYPSQFTPFLS